MSIIISRRKFLTFAAMGVGTYGLWRFGVPFLNNESLDAKFVVGDYDRSADAPGHVGLISAKAELLKSWKVPIKAHAVWQNEARPWQLIAVEKDGLLAAVIDVQSEAPPKIIHAPQGTRFYGHGFFSSDGSLVYVTAQEEKRKGLILVYDSISMQVLNTIDSKGYRPHDLQVDRQNPSQFLIANAGTPKQQANISWFSLATGDLVKQVSLDKPGYSPAHIWQREGGEIYFTGSDNREKLDDEEISFSVYRPGQDVVQVVSTAWNLPMKGETLNSHFDDANHRIWLSLTYSDRILVVDKTTMQVIKKIKVKERPRSMVEINLDGRRVLSVSYYPEKNDVGRQKFFDLATCEEIKGLGSSKTEFYSIHAYPFHPLKKT